MKGGRFVELVALVDRLRGPEGCPWDREQTFDTLKPMLLEEAYEVLEALDSGDRQEFCTELGDLLFQVVFLAQMAESEEAFQIDDVVQGIVAKMIRRHPHVFSQAKVSNSADVLEKWESIKQQEERSQRSQNLVDKSSAQSLLEGFPAMPALLAAHKLTSKAARVGFDWSHLDEIIVKLHEEIEELKEALVPKPVEPLDSRIEQEVGDLLFVSVNIARFLKIDPETALRKANRKFAQRFRYIEESLRKAGKGFEDSSIEEMEGLWQEAKKVI